MEEQITPTPIVETMPTQKTVPVRTSYHRKTRMGWIIAAVLGAIIIIGIVWYIIRHHKAVPATPIETLQSLENTSRPVTTPAQQQAFELKETSRKSAPVKATADDRIKMLNALK
jgi:hypothetical protein